MISNLEVFLITSTKVVMFSLPFVGLFVCLSVSEYTKTTRPIFMTLDGGVELGHEHGSGSAPRVGSSIYFL